ncbi:MAG: metallophosphoesterase family protein [Caulobacteraceae bacterium]
MADPNNAELTYAVGDIHGRADLLCEALDLIEAHTIGRARRIVFLGDYVDRGPSSAEVVDRLMTLQSRDLSVVCLRGNHEAMMLEALEGGDPGAMTLWLDNGGEATLASYRNFPLSSALGAPPNAHLAWMQGLPLTASDPGRVYVHAGLAPGVSLSRQKQRSLIWIRDAFLAADAEEFDAHVVHGHTPVWSGKPDPVKPERLAHRTNLDTGAFATGILSVGVFRTNSGRGPIEILSAGLKAHRGPSRSRL